LTLPSTTAITRAGLRRPVDEYDCFIECGRLLRPVKRTQWIAFWFRMNRNTFPFRLRPEHLHALDFIAPEGEIASTER
jgi:hypothetical protein